MLISLEVIAVICLKIINKIADYLNIFMIVKSYFLLFFLENMHYEYDIINDLQRNKN